MFLLKPHRYLSDFFFRCNIVPLKTTWEQGVFSPINHCLHHYILLYYINKSLFLSSLFYLWWKFSVSTILLKIISSVCLYVSFSHFDHWLWNYCANWNQTLEERCFYLWDPLQNFLFCLYLGKSMARGILVSDWMKLEKSFALKLQVQMIL